MNLEYVPIIADGKPTEKHPNPDTAAWKFQGPRVKTKHPCKFHMSFS